MKNYTKKPVTIQAVQWNGENIKEMAKFMATEKDGTWVQDLILEELKYPHTTLQGEHWIFDDSVLMIKTLEGVMMASKGDYVIRGIKGEYYPCKPDIFEMTYDAEQEEKNEKRFVVKALDTLIGEEMGNMLLEMDGDRQIFGNPSNPKNFTNYINIQNQKNVKGVPPIVSFTIQSDPISEVGVNGVQVLDMLRYCLHLFNALNDKFPCDENAKTTTLIAEAIYWQQERTLNRQRRGVEGKNEA
jgi:hypothetical protein